MSNKINHNPAITTQNEMSASKSIYYCTVYSLHALSTITEML